MLYGIHRRIQDFVRGGGAEFSKKKFISQGIQNYNSDPVSREVVYIPSCCMYQIYSLWHQQWSSRTNNGAACRSVAEWRVSIFDKGLNSGRSKLMVGSSGGKMIVNSAK